MQDWSPVFPDSVFTEYNEEHIVYPEIDYENPFSIYKLFLSDNIIDLTNFMNTMCLKLNHRILIENTNRNGKEESLYSLESC